MRVSNLKYVKILIIILVQLGLSACNWPSYVKLLSSFTDDPGFDRNLDSNKITQLSYLYYYWPQTSLTLQCLTTGGSWVTLGGSTVTKNSDGSLKDFNANTPGRVVYQHSWSGNFILQVAPNCKITTSNLPAVTTNDWTYMHTQQSITLRAIQSDGTVLPTYSDAERACFGNDPSSDMWQRHFDCNVASNDGSFVQLINENITRNSNWGRLNFEFNKGTNDEWVCSYTVSVDGVNYGIFGNSSISPTPNHPNIFDQKVKKGNHTVSFLEVPWCVTSSREPLCSQGFPCTANTTGLWHHSYSQYYDEIPMTMDSVVPQVLNVNVTDQWLGN